MTTIITRLYADEATAQTVAAALLDQGFPDSSVDVITRDGAGTVTQRMRDARVSAATAAAYQAGVQNGNALVVARAPFTPFGAALRAIDTVDSYPSIPVGLPDDNEYVREQPRPNMLGNVLADHPLMFGRDIGRRRGTVSEAFGLRTVSPDRTKTSAIAGGAFISTRILPFPLLSASRERTSAIRGGWHFSSLLGMPLLSRRH